MPHIIKICSANKKLRDGVKDRYILEDINYTQSAGEFNAILGPSGSGKTTFLQCAAGIDKFSAGKAILCDNNLDTITAKEKNELHNKKVGFVYQHTCLLPNLTTLENVALPLLIRKVSKNIAYSKAKDILAKIGLAESINQFPQALSGGMKQKAAIARAIVGAPAIIFADEPTGNLDKKSRDLILDFLLEIKNSYNIAICLITHDLAIAKLADNAFTLENGGFVS
jgi:ABC-type lipoprotein export system ATPase subunit